jgi:minor histocompatibility antigen H13
LKPKTVKEPTDENSSDEDEEPTVDMVSSDDAWMFPIGGSVMLVGLYVLFKYLNKDYLNYLFTAYFGVIGIFAVSNVVPLIKVQVVDLDWWFWI